MTPSHAEILSQLSGALEAWVDPELAESLDHEPDAHGVAGDLHFSWTPGKRKKLAWDLDRIISNWDDADARTRAHYRRTLTDLARVLLEDAQVAGVRMREKQAEEAWLTELFG